MKRKNYVGLLEIFLLIKDELQNQTLKAKFYKSILGRKNQKDSQKLPFFSMH